MTAASATSPVPRQACLGAALALLSILFSGGCRFAEDGQPLVRQPLLPKTESGWTRLKLDPAAQLQAGEPWIGDEAGKPVAAIRNRPGLWGPRQLDIERLLLGMDSEGRYSAEFTLRLPPSWNLRDREHLRIELALQGKAPWVCRVDVARRLEEPGLLGLPRESPLLLQDLDGKAAMTSILVPWDSREYRVVLQALAGTAPTIRSVKVTAVTEPAAMEPDKVVTPAELQCEIQAPAPERWRIRLAAVERVVGLQVQLRAPAAPVRPVVLLPAADPAAPPRNLQSQDLAWNLPSRGGRGSQILLEPVLTDRLLLALPAGARLEAVKVLVRNDELLFPVQAGRPYWLHLGGKAKPAGPPGELPPSRLIFGRDPIRMGPAEPDPQALPRIIRGLGKGTLRLAALGGAALLALVAAALLFRRREA
jgi:hypothetical protein